MEDVKVKAFLDSGYGYGSGDGSGSGSGDGDGSGSGSGDGDGSGSGSGDGDGSGSGSGDGDGSGYGSGDGSGYGYGYGSGSGDGYGYGGLCEIDGRRVWLVDGVPTIFTSIHGNVAKGYILRSDLAKRPCFVVKGNGLFAHGDDLHEAMDALRDKLFEDMPVEERIAKFIREHPEIGKAYPNRDLFDWHHRLTGSCMAGRNAFVKDRGLSLEGETTVKEFIRLTKDAYGGDVIRRLEEAYG